MIKQVAGKSLHEWAETKGAGKFAEAVRETIDKRYGLDDDEMSEYTVTIECTYSGTDTTKITVNAVSEKHARDVALAEVDSSDFDDIPFDADIDDYEVIKIEKD